MASETFGGVAAGLGVTAGAGVTGVTAGAGVTGLTAGAGGLGLGLVVVVVMVVLPEFELEPALLVDAVA